MSDERILRRRQADPAAMEAAIAAFLEASGFDAADSGHLSRTAERVSAAWAQDLLEGHDSDPVAALGEPFEEPCPDLIVAGDIEFFSTCPHHLMPYKGTAWLAYLPAGRAVGFSGIVRMLDVLAHRLTLQEWLTRDLAMTLMDALQPRGAACILRATPMCAFARGVRRPCRISSSAYLGSFQEDPALRRELLLTCLGEG